jgi:hypothetical protein
MSRNELMHEIRKALGVRLSGTASTISHEGTRRLVATLEMLTDDQLSAVHAVVLKAVDCGALEGTNGNHKFHDNTLMCRDECLGEDILRLRHWIKFVQLDEIYALAPAVDLMPQGMTVRSAREALCGLIIERFDVSSRERVAAHLHVAHELAKDRTGYRPDVMLLVHVHPDKARTIATLAIKNANLPTHREVIEHHDIEPALYDGIL